MFFIFHWAVIRNSAPEKVTGPEVVSRPGEVSVIVAKDSLAFFEDGKNLLREGKRARAIKILEDIVSSNSGTEQAYKSLLLLTDIYRTDGNLLKVREIYLTITEVYPDYCDYPGIQKRLTGLNMDILFSPTPTTDSEIYIVKPGDSLSKIAKAYSTTVELIKRANGLKSDIIRPEMKLKVQKRPFSIIVDKSLSTLTLIVDDRAIKTYIVSTGKNNSTPTGTFRIENKLIKPTWYSAGAIVPADSPENVLGSRWMGITTPEPGIGVHGTTEPESIGYQCTEGCVRMLNAEVEELFDIIPLGVEITIID